MSTPAALSALIAALDDDPRCWSVDEVFVWLGSRSLQPSNVEVFRGNRMCGDELCALDDAGWLLTGVGPLKARSLRLLLDRKVKAAQLALLNVPMDSSSSETFPEVAPLSVAHEHHHHVTTFLSPPRPAKHAPVLPPNPTSPPLGSD
jgi:hypothetical protein